MRQFFTLLFFLFLLSANAQTQPIDSLKSILASQQNQDTLRVKRLCKVADLYQNINPELGIQYAQKALELSKKLNEFTWQILSYQALGMNYVANGQNQKAISVYQTSIRALKKSQDLYHLAVAYHNLAYVYCIQGQHKPAIQLENSAYQICLKLQKKREAIAALNSLGANYFYLSDYKKASAYYFKALALADELKMPKMQALCYENVGLVYKKLENKPKAYEFYQKALSIYQKIDDASGLLNLYTNFGAAKDLFSDSKGALELYQEGLKVAQRVHNPRAEHGLLSNIGIVMFDQKKYESALFYFKKCIDFYRSTHDLEDESMLSQYYAETLISVPDKLLINEGIQPKDKYNMAISYLKKAVAYAVEAESIDEEMAARSLLSKLYEKTKDYPSALKEQQIYSKIKDSLQSIQNKETILKQEHHYQIQKKEALAKAEIERQKVIKYAVIVVFAVLFLLAGILFMNYRRRQADLQYQKELLLKAKISDVELQVLRLQMNPHFIFNSLNSIGDYIQKSNLDQADYYLTKFAKLMRAMLESSSEKEITIAQEIKMLELYMQLEASRLGHKFTYEFIVDPSIDPETTMIPPMLLQPFVENSIWHGLHLKDGTGKITIEFALGNELLQVSVEDDGIGRKQAAPSDHKSFGLRITQERLEVLSKLKGAHTDLKLIDLEQGTRVEIELPVEIDND